MVIVGADHFSVEILYTMMRYCLMQQSCSVYCLYPCLLDNKKLKKKKIACKKYNNLPRVTISWSVMEVIYLWFLLGNCLTRD